MPGAEGSTPAEVRVLGPVEVWADGVAVPLPPLVRSLLAVLVADAGRVVSVDRLVDALWAGHPPADARNRLQAAVSALRRALNAPGLPSIVTTPPGYALRGNDGVDADRFATLLGRARTLAAERSTAEAIAAYGQALGLWRGSPFDGTDATGLDAASARLEEMQLAATEEWLQTRLDAGRYADAVAELTGLVAIHPLRERLRGLLMQALHRSGRTSDAVAAYRAWHSVACQELGLEPGAEIQHILRDILGGEASPAPASAEVPMLRPQQLPASVADFTGRDDDLRRLVSVLRRGGTIAVVTGMGGIGKTTLAVRGARLVADAYPDGCLYADLHGTIGEPVDPHHQLGAFLRALGVAAAVVPGGLDERLGLYRSLTSGRRLLVVLDDAREEAQVRPLMPTGERCGMVVTSRTGLLGLDAPARFPLEPMPIAQSVALLAAIAGTERIGDDDTARELADLCGGLPLAVRIVGARLAGPPRRSLAQVAVELSAEEGALDALTAGDRSVRACFTLSYQPLEPAARTLLRVMGSLPGTDVTAHACAVVLRETPPRTRHLLNRLTGAHLVTEAAGDEPRYRMHDLVRRFARELAQAEDGRDRHDEALQRLTDHYADTARAASSLLTGGRTDQLFPRLSAASRPLSFTAAIDAMNWFQSERDNVRAVIAECAERGRHERVWRLACALRTVYRRTSEFDDWLASHRLALDAALTVGDHIAEARVREGLGSCYMELADPQRAREQWTITLRLLTDAGDDIGAGRSHDSLGTACGALGDLDTAIAHHQAALAIPAYAAHPQYAAMAQLNLGSKFGRLGRLDEAHDAFLRALEVSRHFGDSEVVCLAEHNLAEVFLRRGDHGRAAVHAREEIRVAKEVGYAAREARGWEILGTALTPADPGAAEAAFRRALDLYERLHHPFANRLRVRLAGQD